MKKRNSAISNIFYNFKRKGPMKIIELKTQNVKRIKAVTINPDGSVIVVGGQNAQGKTSVLDSIMYALAGRSSLPDKPIREGEDNAKISLDLGEYIVTRRINHKDTSVTIKNKDGATFGSPQTMLDGLVGSLSFDPLEFSRMKPQEQAKTLMGFSDFDFKSNSDSYDKLFLERTALNKEVSKLTTKLGEIEFHEDLPEEPINVHDIYVEIEDAKLHNKKLDIMEDDLTTTIDDRVSLNSQRDSLIKDFDKLKADFTERISNTEKLISEKMEAETDLQLSISSFIPTDTTSLEETLKNSSEINNQINNNLTASSYSNQIVIEQVKSSGLSVQLGDLKKERLNAIANTDLPVDGVTFDTNGVSYNGTPFSQCCSSEQLRVSVAVGLALNPKLKILLIRDGSLLDENNLSVISDLIEKADAQCWIERVGTGDEVTVVIEDGSVSDNGK